jgi:hypothetical protein
MTFNDFRTATLSSRREVGQEDIYYSEELLDAARSNLQACRLLYAKRQYAESVLLLQQAAEKVTKAFLLLTGLTGIADLKTAGHSAVKTSALILERAAPFEVFLSDFERGSDHLNSIVIPIEVAQASEESIMETVADSEKRARELTSKLVDWLKEEKTSGHMDAQTGRRFNLVMEFTDQIVSYAVCTAITYYTSSHAVSSRYPGMLSPKDYNLDLGIVAATPRLLEITDRAISAVERVLLPRGKESKRE